MIGAGLSGLAAACQLAGRGLDVRVIEREIEPGGRAARLHSHGFSIDTGPTVLTMPGLLDRAFAAVGADREHDLPLTRLDPAYRAIFADGTRIDVRAGVEAMSQEIGRTCSAEDAEAFRSFAEWLERLYRLEMPYFIEADLTSPADLLSHPAAMAELVRMGGFSRLGPMVRRRFADDRLHRLFSFQAMYAGLSPAQALSIYAVITYMDCVEGVYTCEGGMHAVPRALATAAQRAGVRISYGRRVTAVLRGDSGRVAGVELSDGTREYADAVIATGDLPVVYEELLPDVRAPRVVRRGRYSPSCVVWALGVRGVPEHARHHNIHFADDWDGAFDALIDGGRLMPDPSRFVCVPSLSDPGLAPDGHSALYVLEPVPNLAVGTIDWEREAPAMRARMADFLIQEGYLSSLEDVVVEDFLTPRDWHRRGMRHGTPFALAHTFFQTGPFRPGISAPSVPGMFFAGSGTLPGVGVPMVLISGELAAAAAARYLGR